MVSDSIGATALYITPLAIVWAVGYMGRHLGESVERPPLI